MKKIPFLTLEKAKEIREQIPTPFHVYDEAGIRANVRALKAAFSWNPGFKEFFAVKATPNPFLLKILHEEGCGCDCATYTELLLSEAVGITGHDVVFSSNVTPELDMRKARDMGVYINLDDAPMWIFWRPWVRSPRRCVCGITRAVPSLLATPSWTCPGTPNTA